MLFIDTTIQCQWRKMNSASKQCSLNAWAHTRQLPGVPMSIGPHTNLYMLYTACFLMFKHWFCWKYQYNKYMFNFIDIYSFIPVIGYIGMGSSSLLCLGAYHAVKTALPLNSKEFSIIICIYKTCHKSKALTVIQSSAWGQVLQPKTSKTLFRPLNFSVFI